jgi:hypothetical protein
VEVEDSNNRTNKIERVTIVMRKPCCCGSLAHQRTMSLQCISNKIYVDAPEDVMNQLKADYEEQHAIDTATQIG